jgi:hypothetical protein
MRSVVKLMVGVLVLVLGIGAGVYVEHVFLAEGADTLIQHSQAQNGYQSDLSGLVAEETSRDGQRTAISTIEDTEQQAPAESLWNRIQARVAQWVDNLFQPALSRQDLNHLQLVNESLLEALQLQQLQLRQQLEQAETKGEGSAQALRYQLNLVERTIFQSPRFLLLASTQAQIRSLLDEDKLASAYQMLQNVHHYLNEVRLRFVAAEQVYPLRQTMAVERQALAASLGRLDLESSFLSQSLGQHQRELAQLEAGGLLSRFVEQAQRFVLDMQESNRALNRLASALDRARLNQAK